MDLIAIFISQYSTSGHKYLLVDYNYYATEILVEPLKPTSKDHRRRMGEDQ